MTEFLNVHFSNCFGLLDKNYYDLSVEIIYLEIRIGILYLEIRMNISTRV